VAICCGSLQLVLPRDSSGADSRSPNGACPALGRCIRLYICPQCAATRWRSLSGLPTPPSLCNMDADCLLAGLGAGCHQLRSWGSRVGQATALIVLNKKSRGTLARASPPLGLLSHLPSPLRRRRCAILQAWCVMAHGHPERQLSHLSDARGGGPRRLARRRLCLHAATPRDDATN
jgi:hypothetical protein